jgi:hypothetical protein
VVTGKDSSFQVDKKREKEGKVERDRELTGVDSEEILKHYCSIDPTLLRKHVTR